QKSSTLRAPQRRVAKACSKGCFVQLEQVRQINAVYAVKRLKLGLVGARCFMIPRANILADVAAEQPFAHAATQLKRNRISQFDCQITDALSRIEHVRIYERLRRTSIEAR